MKFDFKMLFKSGKRNILVPEKAITNDRSKIGTTCPRIGRSTESTTFVKITEKPQAFNQPIFRMCLRKEGTTY